jgi:hypothetical protein
MLINVIKPWPQTCLQLVTLTREPGDDAFLDRHNGLQVYFADQDKYLVDRNDSLSYYLPRSGQICLAVQISDSDSMTESYVTQLRGLVLRYNLAIQVRQREAAHA